MRNRPCFPALLLSGFILSFFMASANILQAQNETCESVIANAFDDVASSCAGVSTNTICYGFEELAGELIADANGDVAEFTTPGDILSFEEIRGINLEPLVRTEPKDTIGITILSAQMNLPANYSQDAIVIALGDVQILNETSEAQELDVAVPPLVIDVVTNASTPLVYAFLFTDPAESEAAGRTAPITVPNGTTLPADVRTTGDDGQEYVRVIYNGVPGWVSVSVLETVDVSDLPIYSTETNRTYTLYQNLELQTVANSNCGNYADVVFTQSPMEAPIDFTANCVDYRLDPRSFALFKASGDTVTLTTLVGVSYIFPDTPEEVIVPLATTVTVTTSGNLPGDDNCAIVNVTQPAVVSQAFLNGLGVVGQLPQNILNFIPQLPIIIQASGVGQPLSQVNFNDPVVRSIIEDACSANLLPAAVCQAFGF